MSDDAQEFNPLTVLYELTQEFGSIPPNEKFRRGLLSKRGAQPDDTEAFLRIATEVWEGVTLARSALGPAGMTESVYFEPVEQFARAFAMSLNDVTAETVNNALGPTTGRLLRMAAVTFARTPAAQVISSEQLAEVTKLIEELRVVVNESAFPERLKSDILSHLESIERGVAPF